MFLFFSRSVCYFNKLSHPNDEAGISKMQKLAFHLPKSYSEKGGASMVSYSLQILIHLFA